MPRNFYRTVAFGAVLAASASVFAQTVDLNVTYIKRLPQYDYDALKNNPEPGDTVTYVAHVKNWGPDEATDIAYTFRYDGVPVLSGTITSLAAGAETSVGWWTTWDDQDHLISLEIDPNDQIAETSEQNNVITDHTKALIVGFWVEQSLYDYFHANQWKLGDGANSWEDWAQRQIRRWNELNEDAIWDIAPNGVLDRFRLDKIIVVPDGALPLGPWGLPTNNPDVRDKSVDLMWGFPATHLDSTFYSNHTSTSENNPFFIEKSLLHELGHARYLIDNYGFDVHNTSGHHSVQIFEGGTYVAGSHYMPFLAFGEVLYYNQHGGVMSGPYGWNWSPYEAAALNLIAGNRAECGNYNAPCNIGEYLQDLPFRNYLRILDKFGRPRVGANVRIYQADPGPGWYGKTFDNTYDLEFSTDAEGYINLGSNPFSDGPIIHTWGEANGVMILRIAHEGQIWYRFMEVTEFNMQYWQGNTLNAYYDLAIAGDETLPADLNGDGCVDFDDFSTLVNAWGPGNAGGDVNGDGDTDFDDFSALINSWGVGC